MNKDSRFLSFSKLSMISTQVSELQSTSLVIPNYPDPTNWDNLILLR